jgi:hypothetical protein
MLNINLLDENNCSFKPDQDTPCGNCHQVPTVVLSGSGYGNTGLCGPCYFGTAEALDPDTWSES